MKTSPIHSLTVAVFIGLACAVSTLSVSAQPARHHLTAIAKPALQPDEKLMLATADGKRTDVLVYGHGFADLSRASQLEDKGDKTRYVFEALTRYANDSQTQLRRDLAARGAKYEVLWLANALWVQAADREMVLWLHGQPEVAKLTQDVPFRAQLGMAERGSDPIYPKNAQPEAIEPGVQQVNAPAVWAMGYRGRGIVVADLDTGVQWDHASLKAKYRGWDGITVTHDYNWFDPIEGRADAFDDHRHGTHTVGTVLGDDGLGNQIGVAPDAKWIACRNMDHGEGSVARYTKCFQFALAPTDTKGNNPTPSKAADITSNSWGCAGDAPYFEEGCEVPDALLNIAKAMRAAGMMTVASAGNDGPSCETVHHAPATLNQAFTVGAVTHGNQIATFSARGPSVFTGQLKPDLVAPGVNVRSAALGGGYNNLSGTSMAAPHVSGVVALLWSAVPWLRGQIDETEAVLRHTATPINNFDTICNQIPTSVTPNNTYGFGLINAKAAVERAQKADIGTTQVVSNSGLVTVTHTITNQHYTLAMTNLTVSVTLPANAEVLSLSNGGVRTGNVVTWRTATLTPGLAYQVTLVLNASANAPVFERQFNRVPVLRVGLPITRR
ncbi:MAG: S8 family serine peptidase [Anaerolineae bacterium]|nr:S8 family serine peptidase [Anaerolineae bacterium]